MKRYLSSRATKEAPDPALLFESVVITIAQHFHISPMEVWNMPPEMTRRVYGWVLAIQDERQRMAAEAAPSPQGGETVTLDYSAWLEGDDIHG